MDIDKYLRDRENLLKPEEKLETRFVGERGFFGDIGTDIARGVVGTVGMLGESGGVLAGDRGEQSALSKWAEEAPTKYDILKPDVSEYRGEEGWLKESFGGAMESLAPSLSGAIPGAAVGATIGSAVPVVGTAIGGVVGAALGSLGLFGLSSYGETFREAKAAGKTDEEANVLGWKMGAIEGGIQSGATLIEAITAGLLNKGVTRPATTMIKTLLKTPKKEIAKNYAKMMGTEISTEMTQSYLGAETMREAGIRDTTGTEAAFEAMGPAMIMSLMFGMGAHAHTAAQQKKLRDALNSDNAGIRKEATKIISGELRKNDAEIADAWDSYSAKVIKDKAPFDMDEDFVELSKGLAKEETKLIEYKEKKQITDPADAKAIVDEYISTPQVKEDPAVDQIDTKRIEEALDVEPGLEEIRLNMIGDRARAKMSDKTKEQRLAEGVATGQQQLYEETIDVPGGYATPAQESAAAFREGERTIPMIFAEEGLTRTEEELIQKELGDARATGYKGVIEPLIAKHKNAGINNIMDMLVEEYQSTKNLKHRKALGDEIQAFFEKAEEQLGIQKGTQTITQRQDKIEEAVESRSIEDIQDTADAIVNVPPTKVTKRVQTAQELDPATTATEVTPMVDTGTTEAKLKLEEEFQRVEEEAAAREGIEPLLAPDVIGDVTENAMEAKTSLTHKGTETRSSVEEAYDIKEAGGLAETVVGEATEVSQFAPKEKEAEVTNVKWDKMEQAGAARFQKGSDGAGTKWTLINNGDGVVHVFKGDELKVPAASFTEPIMKPGVKKKYRQLDQARDYIEANAVPVEKLEVVKEPKVTKREPTKTVIRRTKDKEIRTDIKLEVENTLKAEGAEGVQEGVKPSNVTKYKARDVITELEKKIENDSSKLVLQHMLNRMDPKLIDELELEYSDTLSNPGLYWAKDHKVQIRRGSDAKVLMHELVHAVTSRQIYLDSAYKEKIDTLYDDFLNRRTEKMYQYGITNSHEFLAEAISNKAFQWELKRIKSSQNPKKSIFKRLKEHIVSLFQTKNLKERNMLMDAIDAVVTDHPGMIEKKASDLDVIKFHQKRRKDITRKEYKPEAAMEPGEARLVSQLEEKESVKEKAGAVWESTKKTLSKYIQTSSSVLNEITPILGSTMTEYERQVNKVTRDRLKDSSKFVSSMKRLKKNNKRDYAVLDFAYKNGDEEKVNEILNKHKGIKKEFEKVRKINEELYAEMEKYGLAVDKTEGLYMHREVKDMEGLKKHLDKLGKKKTEYQLIMEELKKTKDNPSHADVAEVYAEMMRTGTWPQYLRKPSAAKLRSIKKLSIGMNKFYESTEDALVSNIVRLTDALESRKILGISSRKEWLKEIDKINKEDLSELSKEEREAKLNRRDQLIESVKDTEKELEGSIANFFGRTQQFEGLTQDEKNRAMHVMKARFQQKHMGKGMGMLRDMALLSAIGNPYSTITQLGDLPHIIYNRGLKHTLQALMATKQFTGKDFDFSGYIKETESASGLTHLLDKTLKLTQFQKVDQFFKATAMQAAIEQAKDMDTEQFVKEYGQEHHNADEIHKDIKSGKKTDNVAKFVWKELSKRQPISATEMPVGYLLGGNKRIMYTLKSYNIKALNSLRDDFIKNRDKMGVAKASLKTLQYVSLLTMAGVGADELKDVLSGKDHGTLKDSVLDNIGKIFFMSRYSQVQLGKTGPGGYIQDLLMPATGFADNPAKDLYALATGEDVKYKTLKEIPVVGKWAYDRSKSGKLDDLRLDKKGITEDMRDDVEAGKSLKSMRGRIKKYNKKARALGERTISFMAYKKRYEDQMKEDR